MDIETVRTEIQNRRKNGETYEVIGKHFDIQKSMVKYIEDHPDYKPSPYISKKLNLEPSKKLQATRIRRSTLNKIARYWKYANWSDYETKVIENFEKCFDFDIGEWKED